MIALYFIGSIKYLARIQRRENTIIKNTARTCFIPPIANSGFLKLNGGNSRNLLTYKKTIIFFTFIKKKNTVPIRRLFMKWEQLRANAQTCFMGFRIKNESFNRINTHQFVIMWLVVFLSNWKVFLRKCLSFQPQTVNQGYKSIQFVGICWTIKLSYLYSVLLPGSRIHRIPGALTVQRLSRTCMRLVLMLPGHSGTVPGNICPATTRHTARCQCPPQSNRPGQVVPCSACSTSDPCARNSAPESNKLKMRNR